MATARKIGLIVGISHLLIMGTLGAFAFQVRPIHFGYVVINIVDYPIYFMIQKLMPPAFWSGEGWQLRVYPWLVVLGSVFYGFIAFALVFTNRKRYDGPRKESAPFEKNLKMPRD